MGESEPAPVKICFLDIDGVLNADYGERDKYGHLFTPESFMALIHIVTLGYKFVISGSWRMSGLETLQAMWEYRELPGELIGITYSLEETSQKSGICNYDLIDRGHEIIYTILSKSDIPYSTDWFVIDDVDDFGHFQSSNQNNKLFLVNPKEGLTLSTLLKWIEDKKTH